MVLDFHPERSRPKVEFLLDQARQCPVAAPPPMTMIINIPERVLLIKVSRMTDANLRATGYPLVFYDITDIVASVDETQPTRTDARRRLLKIPTAQGWRRPAQPARGRGRAAGRRCGRAHGRAPEELARTGWRAADPPATHRAVGRGVDEVVVLGHHAEHIKPVVQAFPVTLARNLAPQDGQVSSLRIGLAALTGKLDAVLVALADKPLINAQDITNLIAAYKKRAEGTSVAVPMVGGEPGNPAMFGAEVLEQILTGGANVGCRQWRRREPAGRARLRHRQPALPRRCGHRRGHRPLRARHRPPPALAVGPGTRSSGRPAGNGHPGLSRVIVSFIASWHAAGGSDPLHGCSAA